MNEDNHFWHLHCCAQWTVFCICTWVTPHQGHQIQFLLGWWRDCIVGNENSFSQSKVSPSDWNLFISYHAMFGPDIGILPELLSLSMFSKYTRRCQHDFESSNEFFLQSRIFLMSFISFSVCRFTHSRSHDHRTHQSARGGPQRVERQEHD